MATESETSKYSNGQKTKLQELRREIRREAKRAAAENRAPNPVCTGYRLEQLRAFEDHAETYMRSKNRPYSRVTVSKLFTEQGPGIPTEDPPVREEIATEAIHTEAT